MPPIVRRQQRAGTMRVMGRRARYVARSAISTYPLYLPVARRKYRHLDDRVVDSGTEIVIEGFERSGNTFAVFAFQLAQLPRDVKMAHHLHSAAQVVAAARLGIPTLLLIRDPVECVGSHLIREPEIRPKQALGSWLRFYRTASTTHADVVVADFRETTSDFGAVIERVNDRFRTRFATFEHSEENVRRCFVLADERNRARYGTVVESLVARPSTERAERKQEVMAALRAPELADLRSEAYSVYRALTGGLPRP